MKEEDGSIGESGLDPFQVGQPHLLSSAVDRTHKHTHTHIDVGT